jgi:hypothetical protein
MLDDWEFIWDTVSDKLFETLTVFELEIILDGVKETRLLLDDVKETRLLLDIDMLFETLTVWEFVSDTVFDPKLVDELERSPVEDTE